MLINHASKQVTAKIVYYGPGLSGKTSNLQYIFSVTNPKSRGELVSIETDIERTLFFDLLPINVGLIKGYQTKFQLYTVPGQIFYDATRKLVLKGADGIVFVADSQELMEDANLESFENLETNLAAHHLELEAIPFVLQYNKRDLKNISSTERLNLALNREKWPFFEAVATKGTGVVETLREISSLTLVKINELIEHTSEASPARPSIQFDTDQKQKIIKREDLPYKKISLDRAEGSKESPGAMAEDEIHIDIDDMPLDLGEFSLNQPDLEQSRTKVIQNLDVLDKLEDKSRMTVLKKIQLKDPKLIIDIKNNGAGLVQSVPLEIKPGVKKVTLILDLE
jgi:small GTP-binding protein